MCYYGFEGNPTMSKFVKRNEAQLRSERHPARLFHESVVHMHDGFANFTWQRGAKSVSSRLDVSSSAAVASIGGGSLSHISVVSAVDGARFLRSIANRSGFVALKIDVEQFEYQLLPYLLTHGGLCGVVSILVVEWHFPRSGEVNHPLDLHTAQEESARLTRQIEGSGCGVRTLHWV